MPQALHCDLYSLTMSQMCWKRNMNDRVAFELFVRKLPPHRGYLVAAGLGTALWTLRRLHYSKEDIDYLASIPVERHPAKSPGPLFDPGFLSYLHDLDFSCDIDAVHEGVPMFAQEPILRVTGPRIEALIVESLLLSIINHQTMVASKASRIVRAAEGRPVWDFSLRRLHGPEASLGVARAAYIAGCAGTATVEAGRILHIPLTGTMAHALPMAYGEEHEQQCFEDVLRAYPHNHALLIDTFDPTLGVKRAIDASVNTQIPLKAIRLDSDVANLSEATRIALDVATATKGWFKRTKIIASGDLDESSLRKLRRFPIDSYGVGTMLGTSADAPHLGGVYKMVEQIDRHPQFLMKLTPGKQTDPGRHQIWRFPDGDLIALHREDYAREGATQLLEPVMRLGRVTAPLPSLEQSRLLHHELLQALPVGVCDLRAPAEWPVNRSEALWELRAKCGDAEASQEIEKRGAQTSA